MGSIITSLPEFPGLYTSLHGDSGVTWQAIKSHQKMGLFPVSAESSRTIPDVENLGLQLLGLTIVHKNLISNLNPSSLLLYSTRNLFPILRFWVGQWLRRVQTVILHMVPKEQWP